MRPAQFQHNPRINADVQLLLGRYRDLIPDGRIIAHEEIESLLKLNRKQGRYQTVTNKWRRVLLEEQRVYLDGRSSRGVGFTVLTPDDMVRFGNREIRAVGRRVRKAIQVAGLPDPSSLTTSDLRNYQARLMVACHQIESTHKRALIDLTQVLRPARGLPRASGA